VSKPPKDLIIEPLLLAATRVSTFDGNRLLTGASGFFFEREGRLFLVTSRHVVIDEPSKHFPDRIEIELHTDASNLTCSTGLSILLYREGKSVWRQGKDPGGEIDVASNSSGRRCRSQSSCGASRRRICSMCSKRWKSAPHC